MCFDDSDSICKPRIGDGCYTVLRLMRQLSGQPVRDGFNASILEEVVLIGCYRGEFPVSANDERGSVFPNQASQAIHDGPGSFGIHVAGGFIGEYDGRAMDQGPGNSHALLLTYTKLGRQMLHAIAEFQPFKHLTNLPLSLGPGQRGVDEGRLHVLARSPRGDEVETLEDETDGLPSQNCELSGAEVFEGSSGDLHVTGRGAIQASQNLQESGFTRAAAASNHHSLTSLNVQVDVGEDVRNPASGDKLPVNM